MGAADSTGLALGSVLVLLAVGLSLIFGMLAVVNFAHGAFYTVGAYAGVFVFGLSGNFWLRLGGGAADRGHHRARRSNGC